MPNKGRGKGRGKAQKAACSLDNPPTSDTTQSELPSPPQADSPTHSRSPSSQPESPIPPLSQHQEDAASGDEDTQQQGTSTSQEIFGDQTKPSVPQGGRRRKNDSGRSNYRKNINEGNEDEMVEFFKDHRSLWDIRHKDYSNRDVRQSLLQQLSQSVRVSVPDIDGWWKGIRDTFTKLSKTKSGDGLKDLPYKQNWILTKLSFLRERPTSSQDPVKRMKSIIDDNAGDLAAAEREAAKQGKEAAKKQGKGQIKSRTRTPSN